MLHDIIKQCGTNHINYSNSLHIKRWGSITNNPNFFKNHRIFSLNIRTMDWETLIEYYKREE